MLTVATLQEALDDLVPQVLRLCRAPGLSLAVGVGERVVHSAAYGLADIHTERPMTPDTVSPTGSDSKPWVGVAAMQLVERGALELDGPVNDHLDFPVVNPHGERAVTLHDLLTHRSGLGTTVGFCDLVPPAPLGEHLQRVFAEGRTDMYGGDLMPLWATPVGAHYQYANTGIALVGYLIERANPEGLSLPHWLQQHVFEPLGMSSSCLPPVQDADHVPAGILERRSTGYATLEGFTFRLPQIHVADYPAGTGLTTPSDHVRFLLAMVGEGALGPARILRNDTARQMLVPQAPRGIDPSTTIGLIWNLFHHGTPAAYFGHGGEYMWGWHHLARGWPNERAAVAISVNQYDLGDHGTSDRPSHLAGRLVLDVINAWVRGHDPRADGSAATLRSRMAGLVVGDRLTGRLGIPTPVGRDVIASIAAQAVIEPSTPWDPTAFESGVARGAEQGHDLLAAATIWQDEIPEHVRDLVARQLGIPGLAKLGELAGLTQA